jgi:hypothetical protein
MIPDEIPTHNRRIIRAMGRLWRTLGELRARVAGKKPLTTSISARIRENRLVYGVDYEKRVRAGTKGTWEYRLA